MSNALATAAEELTATEPGSTQPAAADQRRPLKLSELWNMNFGYLGIQFGWGLQGANMAAIYTKLGAHADNIPILIIAGPITGMLVQPIIGAMSDRTWSNRFGRRRPYFTVGAILASVALLLMPTSPALWVAATLLWVLDASINISMEPFRAFVADKLPISQRATGFLMQCFFIGLGQTLAQVMPWVLHQFGVSAEASNGVPLSVLYSFRIGAAAFLGAVLWTVFRTPEYPPDNIAEFEHRKRETRGFLHMAREIGDAVRVMPATMRQLFGVQFFTWFGLSCTWGLFTLAVARNVYHTTNSASPAFDRATEWSGLCMAVPSIVCFLIAPVVMPMISARIGRPRLHAVSLLVGGIGIVLLGLVTSKYMLLPPVAFFGIAWASIIAVPYAILSVVLPPERMGVYMGIFNFSIVLPQTVYSIVMPFVIRYLLDSDPIKVVVIGGISMLIAAALAFRVVEHAQPHVTLRAPESA